jgi:hypothetical protein
MENVRVLLTFRIPQPLNKNTTNKTKKTTIYRFFQFVQLYYVSLYLLFNYYNLEMVIFKWQHPFRDPR